MDDYALAESVRAGRGAYALLLGSGMSQASGMPTAWGVKEHLVRKLAVIEGIDPGPDPIAWYKEYFGRAAEYGELLETLGRTQADRSNILKDYFEPSEQERIDGRKQPTAAHRAVAQLVAGGYIRVIVTTNFDRLMEQALQAEGIEPTVISAEGAARNQFRLFQDRCTIVKINGDYLDPYIRNTADELHAYPEPLEALMERIFSEFGLIICGWSGEYDDRVRDLMTACDDCPYATYFAHRGSIAANTQAMLNRRGGHLVRITSADAFFETLAIGVEALSALPGPENWTTAMVAEQARRFIPDPVHRVRLTSLVNQQVDTILTFLDSHSSTRIPSDEKTQDATGRWFEQAELVSAGLISIMSIGGYHGTRNQSQVWSNALGRLVEGGMSKNEPRKDFPLLSYALGRGVYTNDPSEGFPHVYPALLAWYAFGIAAMAAEDYGAIVEILRRTRIEPFPGAEAATIHEYANIDTSVLRYVPSQDSPLGFDSIHVAEYLFESRARLWPTALECIGDDKRFQAALFRFEFLYSLEILHQRIRSNRPAWTSSTMLSWHERHYGQMLNQLPREQGPAGDSWEPLVAGFFGGTTQAFMASLETYPRVQGNDRYR